MAKSKDMKNIYTRTGGGSFQVKLYAHGKGISATFGTLEEAQTYRDTIRANKTHDKLERSIKEERVERLANKAFTLHAALEKFKAGISDDQASKPEQEARVGKMQRMPIAQLNFYGIRPQDVYAMLDEIGGSSENRRIYALLLSKVFKEAKSLWRMKVDNPVSEIKLPQKNKPRERRLSLDEYDLIKANIPAAVLSVIIIAIETAARRSEILNALKSDLNIEGRTLLLRKTKNGEQRQLPLSLRAIEVLKNIKTDGDKLFGNISVWKLRYEFEKMRVKTGLLDLHFHDLRHEAISRMVERGKLNLLEVAVVAGHKGLPMTARYTHLIPTDLAKKLD